jgi:hypothetical protein
MRTETKSRVTSFQAATNFFLFVLMFAGLLAPYVAIPVAILLYAARRRTVG